MHEPAMRRMNDGRWCFPPCSIVARRGIGDWDAVRDEFEGAGGPVACTAEGCRELWLDCFASRVLRCIEVDVFGLVAVLVQEEPGRGCFLHPDGDGMCFKPSSGEDGAVARPGDAVRLRLGREMRPMRSLLGPASFQGHLLRLL